MSEADARLRLIDLMVGNTIDRKPIVQIAKPDLDQAQPAWIDRRLANLADEMAREQ